jgi:hypothetical protein
LSRLSFCPNVQHSVSSTGGLISPFSLFFLLLLLMIYNEIFLRPIRWIFHPEKKKQKWKIRTATTISSFHRRAQLFYDLKKRTKSTFSLTRKRIS